MLESSFKNTSKIWKVINNIINRQNIKDSHFPNRLEVNQKSYTKPLDIVNKLNTYFSNIGKQTSTKTGNSLDYTDNMKNVSNSFFWFDVTEIEVCNIIKNLDQNKASGEDNISVKILKKVNNFISPALSELINQAFYEGVYPNSLKLAKVIPIFKSGLKTLPGNYRPISLLSNLNKIIEKVIYTRLYSFFLKIMF